MMRHINYTWTLNKRGCSTMPLKKLELLEQCIEREFPGSIVDRCSEQSCSLNLRKIPHRIIVKGERASEEKICDCIIFLETDDEIKLCLTELKSKNLHVDAIPEKFRNGVCIAFRIFEECDITTPHPLFLVLHKSARAPEYRKLSSKRVYMNGKGEPIRIKRCGSSLSELLEEIM